jgi:bacterioferritin-associated ferredoxin
MYVCVCNAVTDRDIGRAVDEGCCTFRQLREQLGVGTCCGRCSSCAHKVLKDSLHTRHSRHPVAAMQFAAA